MNKKILLVLVFVLAGITNVMANTSKDEMAEYSTLGLNNTYSYQLGLKEVVGSLRKFRC